MAAVTKGGMLAVRSGSRIADAAGRLFIPAGHLHVSLRIGNQRVRLGLASGSRRRGDSDERQKGELRFVEAAVIFHAAAVREEKVDSLRAVEAASPTQTDQEIDPFAASDFERTVNVFRRRIGSHVVEERDFESACTKRFDGVPFVAGLFDALVRDDEDPFPAQFLRDFTQPIDGAPPENHTGLGIVVKGSQEVQTRSPSRKERKHEPQSSSGDQAGDTRGLIGANAYLPPALAAKSVDRLAMYSTLLATTGEV